MDIKTKLNDSVKDAMKSGDEVRKRVVRTVLAAIKQVEVDKRTTIDDMAGMGPLQKEKKKIRGGILESQKSNEPGRRQSQDARGKKYETIFSSDTLLDYKRAPL